MKNYKSLNDLKSNITERLSSEIIFDNIDLSLLQSNEILIVVNTNLIGDVENTSFLHIYDWMQKKDYLNYTVYILLPQDIEYFSPVFISTLYLFNQGIKSQFIILGHEENGRTYEFTFLSHSGLLSQNDLSFFTVASYKSENSFLHSFSSFNTKEVKKYVVSEINLPLISLNEENFDFYFKKSFKSSFEKSFESYLFVDENNIFNFLKDSFDNLPAVQLKELKEPYVKLHFLKLLNNLHFLDVFYKLTDKKQEIVLTSYEKKLESFIEVIKAQPIYQIFILLVLLPESIIRKRYLEIYKSIEQTKKDSHNKTLIGTDDEEILSQYLSFVEGQNKKARYIFDGIYELAKNTIEHASTQKGILTAKIIRLENLIKLRNNKSEQGLWQNYFHSTQNIDFYGNEKCISIFLLLIVEK